MRILITGGFGYLGGRIAQFLARAMGANVVLGSRARAVSPAWLPSAEVVVTHWESETGLAAICHGVDAIVHLAGMNAADSARDPAGAAKVNGQATAMLAAAATRCGVRKLVYFSTAHVYGSPLRRTITEDTPPSPSHAYATSHLAGEDAVRERGETGQIDAVIVRLSNAYGAPAHRSVDCWTLLVNDLCRQAVTWRRMQLRGTGLERRDFIPIFDVCRAVAHLLRLPSQGASLFNLGSGWAPTVWEMASLIQQRCDAVLGFEPPLARAEPRADEEASWLEYRIERLASTGFHAGSDRNGEIDLLLRSSTEWFDADAQPLG